MKKIGRNVLKNRLYKTEIPKNSAFNLNLAAHILGVAMTHIGYSFGPNNSYMVSWQYIPSKNAVIGMYYDRSGNDQIICSSKKLLEELKPYIQSMSSGIITIREFKGEVPLVVKTILKLSPKAAREFIRTLKKYT